MFEFIAKQYYVKFYTGAKQLLTGTDMNVYIKVIARFSCLSLSFLILSCFSRSSAIGHSLMKQNSPRISPTITNSNETKWARQQLKNNYVL